MKKSLLMKTMLLLFALVTGSTCAWATTYTMTMDSGTKNGTKNVHWTSNNATLSYSDVNWSASFSGGSITNSNNYVQIGSKSSPFSTITLSTSDIEGTITEVKVGCGAYQSNATVAVTVGGDAFGGDAQSVGTAPTSETACAKNTFSGSASGEIVITITNGTNGRAGYIDYVSVTYTAGATVNVTGVALDQSSLSLIAGENATLTATVSPADATNKAISWESDDTDVATVSNGVVTAVAAGTATITVTTNDGSFTATCDVTVHSAPVASLSFDFSDEAWGFPADYQTAEGTYTNGGYSFIVGEVAADGHKALTTGSGANKEQVALIFGKDGAKITFPAFPFNVNKIKVYGRSGAATGVKFNIFVGDDAVSTEATGSNEDHVFDIAANKQNAGTIYVLKLTTTDKNAQITKIDIFGYETTPAVSADGWATYVTQNACSFEEGDAFVVTSASDKVYLQSVTEVPNNTPVILKGAGAKTANVLPTASAVTNALAISIGGSIDGYVLAKKSGVVGFYKWAGGSLTSGKVYLPSSAVSGAHEFIGFDGETTGISEIETMRNVGNETFYNLNGQKVQNPTKGLYIVNGKKVIIK